MIPMRTAMRLARRVLEYRLTTRRRPLLCSFLVTSRCNLSCQGCSFDHTFLASGPAPRDDMGTQAALHLIHGFARASLPVMIFAGGEPLLRPDLYDLACAARSHGIFSVLFTNGTLIDRDAAYCMDACFHRCLISIDGVAEHNDAVRGTGSFDNAVAGLQMLAARRRRTRVIAACVINRHNASHLAAYALQMRDAGAHGVKFQANFLKNMHPDPQTAEHGVRELLALRKSMPGFIMGSDEFFAGLLDYFRGNASPTCFASSPHHVVVSPWGRLSLCCYRPTELDGVSSARDLDQLQEAACRELTRGCEGCFRYDESVLHALLHAPLREIPVRAIIRNAGI
jgi:MoaA/NifB/PqqE/SkfB family radical SAM enzyme